MPQTIKSGDDVTALMSGADVTDLMNGSDTSKPATPPPDEPPHASAVGRALSGFWEQVNPVTLIKGTLAAAAHPIDTAESALQQQGALYYKAKDAFKQGEYAEGARHAIDYLLPLIGPALDAQGDKAQAGDVAGAVGGTVGLATALAAPDAASGAVAALKNTAVGREVADAAEAGANRRMVETIAPKVGQNKARFGKMASDVAPTLAADADLGAVSRSALAAKVGDKLAAAEAALDAAHDAQNPGRAIPTKPILDALKAKRAELAAQPVEGSRVTPQLVGIGGAPVTHVTMDDAAELPVTHVYRNNDLTQPIPADQAVRDASGKIRVLDKQGRPIGQEVVPGPNRARVAQIDQAISEIQRLGPVARYEALRRIRQAYDGPAKAVYAPSVTADFLAKQGEKLGAADVTGTLRDALATAEPGTAAANANYSLWRKANDVLQATEEVERTRPRVGRKIALSMAGSMWGEAIGGLKGAALGAVLGPIVDGAMASGVTTKIATARALTQLSKAIRAGDAAGIKAALTRVRVYGTLMQRVSGAQSSPAMLMPAHAADANAQPMQLSENTR
jgi:hypothetical protein